MHCRQCSVHYSNLVTSYEHWLGHGNAQLVDDIARCMATSEQITGSNYRLVVKGSLVLRYVNYSLSPLMFDKKLDDVLSAKKERKKAFIIKPVTANARLNSAIEEAEASTAGILIVMGEVTAEKSMLDTLAKQLSAPIMNDFKNEKMLFEGAVQPVTALNIDIRGCILV
jgi:adenylate cyclase